MSFDDSIERVREKAKRIIQPLPKDYVIQTRGYDYFSGDLKKRKGFFAAISVDSKSKINFPRTFCNFSVRNDKNYIEIEYIQIKDPALSKKGYSRKILKVIEEIAIENSISRIHVFHCTNPDFWEHIGYKKQEDFFHSMSESWVKKLDLTDLVFS